MNTPHIRTLVLPKIHSPEDLDLVSKLISHSSASWSASGSGRIRRCPLQLVASIESARSLWNVGNIAQWKPRNGHEVALTTLLVRVASFSVVCMLISVQFAAEDCRLFHDSK